MLYDCFRILKNIPPSKDTQVSKKKSLIWTSSELYSLRIYVQVDINGKTVPVDYS